MTNEDIKFCIDELTARFGEWQPTTSQLSDYAEAMRKHSKLTAMDAVKRLHRGKGLEHRPKLGVFCDLLSTIGKSRGDHLQVPTKWFDITFTCYREDDSGNRYIGGPMQYTWVAHQGLSGAWIMPDSEHLGADCRGRETMYGGKWSYKITPWVEYN